MPYTNISINLTFPLWRHARFQTIIESKRVREFQQLTLSKFGNLFRKAAENGGTTQDKVLTNCRGVQRSGDSRGNCL